MINENNKNKSLNVKTIAEYDNSDIGAEIAKKDFNSNLDTKINEKFKHDIDAIKASYSNLLYYGENNTYPSSSPSIIGGLTSLFNLNLNKEKFRVLEIGCNFGDNLIPYAFNYLNSEFIGVDLSTKAIDLGNQRIKELELHNIKLENKSFTEINSKEYGKFDIIVAHEIYSLISPELQDAMFKLVSDCLSDNGVFYVNYNTLPGWYMSKATSDYLKMACNNFQEPEKQNQVLQHLKFLEKSLSNNNTPYGLAMKQEVTSLLNRPYNYIIYNHMNEYNNAVNFSQICNTAAKYNMQYITEVNLNALIVPEEFKELNEVKDIVLQQSYLDFLTGRRFRTSLFTKNSVVLNKNISQDSIKNMNFYSNLSYSKQINDNLLGDFNQLYKEQVLSNENVIFSINGQDAINSSDSMVKACLFQITKLKYKSNNFEGMVKNIVDHFSFEEEKIKNLLSDLIMKCIINGIIIGHYNLNWDYSLIDTKKPKVSKIVKNQLDRGYRVVTGVNYNIIKLDDLLILLLLNCNGQNTLDDLFNIILDAFKTKKLTISTDSKQDISIEDIAANLNTWIKNYIQSALLNGLLS
ncbi:MAG: methyltransferase domain-containing protein [Rickettsiales bacterium]